jgi:hypothetical protein
MRAGLAVLGFLVPWLPAAAAQGRGEKYESNAGRFSVRFPGSPKETNQLAKSPLGDLTVHTTTYALSDGNAYMVSYTDFPEGAAKPDAAGKLFDGVRDGLLGKDGKCIDETDVTIGTDKHPGRDIEIEKDRKRMKFRVVLREGRLYQVAVIGTASFVKGKDAKTFIDSFELTK